MIQILVPAMYLLAGICAYAALNHFSLGLQRPSDTVHLVFAGLCVLAVAIALARIGSMRAREIETFLITQRWDIALILVFYPFFLWFISLYTRVVPKRLLIGFTVFFLIISGVNLALPLGIQYAQIDALASVRLPWGERITAVDGTRSPWFSVASIGVIAAWSYSLYVLGAGYRREPSPTRAALLIALALYVASSIQSLLARHLVAGPLRLGPFGFLAMIVVMSVALSNQTRRRLRISENRFRSLVEQSPFSIQLLSADGRTLQLNPAWERLWGPENDPLADFRFIVDPGFRDRCFATIQKGRPFTQEGSVSHRDLGDRNVIITYFRVGEDLGVIALDDTERKQAEEAIQQNLAEKDALLRELYHRTKNNMQVIISMLEMEAESIADPTVLDAFRETQNRIHSMALAHEMLYASRDLSRIRLDHYIGSLVNMLVGSHRVEPGRIRMDLDLDQVSAVLDIAVSCGMIVNELVSNVFKYAFPEHRSGTMRVVLRCDDDDQVSLAVVDDGIGLPGDVDPRNTRTMGLYIVRITVERQLQGHVTFRRDSGFACTATFRNFAYPARV